MTYCIDFFRKFKKDGNFCGLDPKEEARITKYLDLIDQIVNKQKIPEAQVIDSLSVRAARPLLSAEGEVRTEGLNFVVQQIKKGKKITNKDLQAKLGEYLEKHPAVEHDVKKVDMSTASDGENTHISTGKGAFSEHVPPAPVTVPLQAAPDAPAAQTLKQKYGGQEEQAKPPQHVAAGPDVSVSPAIPAWSQKLCESGKCPDGNRHMKPGTLGKKCDLSGLFITDMHVCPILERQRRAAAGGFVPASQVRTEPLTGGTYTIPPPMKISKTMLTVTEAEDLAATFISRSGFFTAKEQEQIDELVRAQYEGIRSRSDFLKVAGNWFLAQTEGE